MRNFVCDYSPKIFLKNIHVYRAELENYIYVDVKIQQCRTKIALGVIAILRDYTKEQLEKVIKNCNCISEVLRKLGYGVTGQNPKTLKQLIKEYDIDISHFRKKVKKRSDKEIFCDGSVVSQSVLRERLKKTGLVPYVCDSCGLPPEWQGRPLTLILDHVNGINTDNRIENLHWVCPNCNQQLSTTGYRGVKKYDEYGNRIIEKRIPIEDVTDSKNRYKKYCPKCGRLMSRNAELCLDCYNRQQSDIHLENLPVSREDLKDLIREKSFSEIGRMFGVSDNGIRIWCKKYSLPYSKKEIKSYNRSQWKKI